MIGQSPKKKKQMPKSRMKVTWVAVLRKNSVAGEDWAEDKQLNVWQNNKHREHTVDVFD